VSQIVVQQVEASMAERAKGGKRGAGKRKTLSGIAGKNANEHDLRARSGGKLYFVEPEKREDLSGYKMSETKALRIMDLVGAGGSGAGGRGCWPKKTYPGEVSAPYTLRLVSKEGKRHEVEVSSRLLYENGRATGVQGIARDFDGETAAGSGAAASAKDGSRGTAGGRNRARTFNNIFDDRARIRGNFAGNDCIRRIRCTGRRRRSWKAGNRAAELTQRLLGFSRKQVFENPKILNVNDVVSEISKIAGPTLLGRAMLIFRWS